MDLKEFVIITIDRADKICNDASASPADRREAIKLLELAIKAIQDVIAKIG